MIAGNWDNTQVSLGLKKREEVCRFDEEIDSMTAMLNSSIAQLSQQPLGFFKSNNQKKVKRKKFV